MKVTLEYNLTRDPDRYEYAAVKQAVAMQSFVRAFKDFLRSEYKYGDHEDKAAEAVEKIRDKFYELAQEENINFEDI